MHRPGRYRSVFAVLALLVLTECIYLRPVFLRGVGVLVGRDFDEMHIRRITFARNALFGMRHALPGWYPHEVLGSPFAANLQSFPWIPTRLLLLPLDPSVAYAAGVAMAAALAALFTWLYCRRAGLTPHGRGGRGLDVRVRRILLRRALWRDICRCWRLIRRSRFCCGWRTARLAPERGRRRRFDLAVLAVCTTCVVAAGHPQLPGICDGHRLFSMRPGEAEGGCARECGARWRWAPVWLSRYGGRCLLLIGRSTRVLHWRRRINDIAMPYGRLLALVVPGSTDGRIRWNWRTRILSPDTHRFLLLGYGTLIRHSSAGWRSSRS